MAKFTVRKKAWARKGKSMFTVDEKGRTVVDGTWTVEDLKALAEKMATPAPDDERRRWIQHLKETPAKWEKIEADRRRRLEDPDPDVVKAALVELEAEAHEHQRRMEDQARQGRAQGVGAKELAERNEKKAELHRQIREEARELARKAPTYLKRNPRALLAYVRHRLAHKLKITERQIRNVVTAQDL